MKISIEKIAKLLDGKVIGESSVIIEKINTIEDAINGEISFIAVSYTHLRAHET